MKKIMSLTCYLLTAITLWGQSNISSPMSFHIEKGQLMPSLKIVPNSIKQVDPNNNNIIDAGEVYKICFEVENKGRGDAYGCEVQITINGTKDGISISKIKLPVIKSGSHQTVEVPIKAADGIQTGEVSLKLAVIEPHGCGTEAIRFDIATSELRTPFVKVTNSYYEGAKGGKLVRGEKFKLKVTVQNSGNAVAENVNIQLKTPENVTWLEGTSKDLSVASLRPNEQKILEYILFANQLIDNQFNIQVALKERTGKYAQKAVIPLEVGRGGLVSDVDENIPVTNIKNDNAFVLIIANEDYKHVASVPFALNDGKVFREYCIKTLGIDGNTHIKYLQNATGLDIINGIEWLKERTETFESSQIIVYYTGHGVPDESQKTAYILPVDGDGVKGYKLDRLYQELGKMPARSTIVLLDACFSGANRDGKMITQAKGVAIPVKNGEPQGNTVAFSAAKGNETAGFYKEQGHGLFTYYLLKKMQESRGNISLKDLGDYIVRQVVEKSLLNNNKRQTPCITASPSLGTEWEQWTLKK